jgi:hypothetical protein
LLAIPAVRLEGEGWRRALVGGDRASFSPGATWTTATRSGRRVEVVVQGHDDEILVVLRDLGALDGEDEEDTVSFVSDEAPVPPLPADDPPSAEMGAPRAGTPAGPARTWTGSAAPVRREKSASKPERESPRAFTPPAAPAVVGQDRFDDEVLRALDRRRRQGRPAAVACIVHLTDESAGRTRLLAVAAGVLRGVDVLGEGDPDRIWALLPDTAPAGARRAADRLAEAFGKSGLCIGFATLDADDTVLSAMERARRALHDARQAGRGGIRGDEERRVA